MTSSDLAAAVAAVSNVFQNDDSSQQLHLDDLISPSSSAKSHTVDSNKRINSQKQKKTESSLGKRKLTDDDTKLKEVRVLHILKKHRDSRRPASWRNPSITITKEQSIEEIKELINILQEVADDNKEFVSTFEELARTESDCSSAKRGGDLGFFGRKKMQPTFEKASFSLKVGEMSNIVETSSGVHVILRLG